MSDKEEIDLIKRLSKPPKCMHDPENVEDCGDHWLCTKCGLRAGKRSIFASFNKDIV